MSERWMLLDLETTGLDPHRDLILEVCAIFFKPNPKDGLLAPEDRGMFHRVIGWTPDILRRHLTHPAVIEMHEKNGLAKEVVMADTWTNIDSLFHEWAMSHLTKDDQSIDNIRLVGNSVHFDKAFIDAQWPSTRSLLSHRVTDISTLLDVYRLWHAPVEKGDVAHRALADCMQSYLFLEKFVGALRDPE